MANNPLILYLHGLGSSGQANTALGLKAAGLNLHAPSYAPEDYPAAMAQLQAVLAEQSVEMIVGTSMGGYYALRLAEQYPLPVIAINPCFEPSQLLRPCLNEAPWDYARERPIPFTQTMLDAFVPLQPKRLPDPVIIIGDHDEVIPTRYQQQYCTEAGWSWQATDWGHRVGDTDWLAALIRRQLAGQGK